jgi:hypothetical protein
VRILTSKAINQIAMSDYLDDVKKYAPGANEAAVAARP